MVQKISKTSLGWDEFPCWLHSLPCQELWIPLFVYLFVIQRLYFADAWTDRIESCNVDGSDRTVLLNRRFYFHPFDLTLYDDRIYWTDLYQHTIVSAHKDTGGDRIFISGPFVFPHVIHAVHPSRQLSHGRETLFSLSRLEGLEGVLTQRTLFRQFVCHNIRVRSEHFLWLPID